MVIYSLISLAGIVIITIISLLGIRTHEAIASANSYSEILNANLKSAGVPETVRDTLQVWHAKGCSTGTHLYGTVSPQGVKWRKVIIAADCMAIQIDDIEIEKEYAGVVIPRQPFHH